MSFLCIDCHADTSKINEYYMLKNWLWKKIRGGRHMLCLNCVENRLGRRLTSRDFTDCPLNLLTDPWPKSIRFINRLMDFGYRI